MYYELEAIQREIDEVEAERNALIVKGLNDSRLASKNKQLSFLYALRRSERKRITKRWLVRGLIASAVMVTVILLWVALKGVW